MDAGGLAQMTLPNLHPAGALGVPGSGFASRGKGSHIKHLSMNEAQAQGLSEASTVNMANSRPKTNRSHLLAGLRTAPRTPTAPPSAPPTRLRYDEGLGGGAAGLGRRENVMVYPRTAAVSAFPAQMLHPVALTPLNAGRQMYSLPEQVLAPPAINIGGGPGEEQMDPNVLADLLARNIYLTHQQHILQQQLIDVQAEAAAAAHQSGTLPGNGLAAYGVPLSQQQQHQHSNYAPFSPNVAYYSNAEMSPGVSSFASPIGATQANGFVAPAQVRGQHPAPTSTTSPTELSAQQARHRASPPRSNGDMAQAPSTTNSRFKAQATMTTTTTTTTTTTQHPFGKPNVHGAARDRSPKSFATSSQPSPSLPPPSANAYRAGHKKATSMASCVPASAGPGGFGRDLASPYGPRSAGMPATPMTGTFGPGQGRAGEHPIRQPRGPPPLEDLVAKPTSKHEGSKNFATRRRRRAVHSLVRAGVERRSGRGSASTGSAGNTTPASETDLAFSLASDNESDGFGRGRGRGGSGSSRSSSSSGRGGSNGAASRKPSIGSLRAAVNGAIGSERKSRKEGSRDREPASTHGASAASVSSDDHDGVSSGEFPAAGPDNAASGRRKTPMLVLTSAAKRKSSMF